MTSDVKAALDAWRRAEQHSREIEAMFDRAFTDYAHKRGPEVSDELVRLVAQSRQRANALLTEALSLLKSHVRRHKGGFDFGDAARVEYALDPKPAHKPR